MKCAYCGKELPKDEGVYVVGAHVYVCPTDPRKDNPNECYLAIWDSLFRARVP